MNTHIDIIRKACIAANPNVVSCSKIGCDGHHIKFTLADVLLAIGKVNNGIAIRATGNFMYYGIKVHPNMEITQWSEIFGDVQEFWNLLNDDLTH